MVEGSSYSVIELVKQADMVVKSVMLVLALASVWSWTIVFDKMFKFLILNIKTKKFENTLNFSGQISDFIKISKRKSTHPFAEILSSSMQEWHDTDVKSIIVNQDSKKKHSLIERMRNANQVAINSSISRLEKGLNFMAITGSVAPFIGLFGTVWGIMNSFQGIAISKNTSLAVVAPGIAEALLATAIGLFAAIPAVFFYNIYNNRLNNFVDRMEGFSLILLNYFSRNLDNKK